LHSKGANLQADIFGDPTGDRRAGERVGDWFGVNRYSSLSEW
jgi:hypothetical protein